MIAVATAMMVRIAFVAIRGHLVGVTGRVSFGNYLTAGQVRAHAYIRTLQRMRHRRRLKRENERKTGKDIQDASHKPPRSSNTDVRIVLCIATRETCPRKMTASYRCALGSGIEVAVIMV
jgi:hypothetical protein